MIYVTDQLVRSHVERLGLAGARFGMKAGPDARLANDLTSFTRVAMRADSPDLAVQSAWSTLMDDILLRYAKTELRTSLVLPDHAGMRRARALRHDHWNQSVSLDALASEAGMSGSNFCREFKRRFGLSPHRYQVVLRVQRARTLLAEGEAAAEVASIAGFANRSHLGRHIKSGLGVTPGDLRGPRGTCSLEGLTVSVVGLGGIGSLLAETFAKEGARLIVSDIDQSRKSLADSLRARWLQPDDAYKAEWDVLVPCALGGILTHEMARAVQCLIICGEANNQLASDEVAKTLADRGVIYVPDFISNAGGLMYATAIEMNHRSEAGAAQHVHDGIAKNFQPVIKLASRTTTSTQEAALRVAQEKVSRGRQLAVDRRGTGHRKRSAIGHVDGALTRQMPASGPALLWRETSVWRALRTNLRCRNAMTMAVACPCATINIAKTMDTCSASTLNCAVRDVA